MLLRFSNHRRTSDRGGKEVWNTAADSEVSQKVQPLSPKVKLTVLGSVTIRISKAILTLTSDAHRCAMIVRAEPGGLQATWKRMLRCDGGGTSTMMPCRRHDSLAG